MGHDDLRSESISFQWDFYERALNNYSIIMRMLDYFEEEDSLISKIPKTFVEESLFDTCKIIREDGGVIKEGFFSIEDSRNDIDLDSVKALNGGAAAPSLVRDAFGHRTLYLHPMKKEGDIVGFVILGKKFNIDLDQRFLRELGIVCNIYNKSLLLHSSLRRQASDPLSNGLYENVLHDFPDPLILVDNNGFIGYTNRRAKAEFERGKGLLTGAKIDNVVTGINEDFYRKEGTVRGEVSYKSSDDFKVFRMDRYPVKAVDATWHGLIFKDVLEVKMKEEEASLKDKMENMGMLAGGIAHDFNNLLTGVLGYASLIKNILTDDEKLHKYAEAIEHSAQRAAKLTRHLLNFSRRQKKADGVVDLNVLLEDILFLLRETSRDMGIEKAFDESLPPARGDEAELQNVFLNLCMNAKEAMGGKGLLKVRTGRKSFGEEVFALVEIEDTGQGMDDETREKIFQPYFSTKETTGSNLGMGLYLVDKIVKEHGGFIECESEPGRGTRFTLYFPVHLDVAAEPEAADEPGAKDDLRKRKILVVDDEDVVAELIKGVLAGEGAEVYGAADGYEAIDIFEKRHESIDLVILDMIMPGINGDEVLKVLREIRDDIKIIISSGFMSEDQREKLKEFRVDGFLDKPYNDKDVINAVSRTLSN